MGTLRCLRLDHIDLYFFLSQSDFVLKNYIHDKNWRIKLNSCLATGRVKGKSSQETDGESTSDLSLGFQFSPECLVFIIKIKSALRRNINVFEKCCFELEKLGTTAVMSNNEFDKVIIIHFTSFLLRVR